MTVKSKLALIGATALGALAIIFIVSFLGDKYERRAQNAGRAATQAQVALLEVQRLGREFIERPNDTLARKFKDGMEELDRELRTAADEEPELAERTTVIQERAGKYAEEFEVVVQCAKAMGYTPGQGLMNRVNTAVDSLEGKARKIVVSMGDILMKLAELRSRQKDFLLQHGTDEIAAFEATAVQLAEKIKSNTLLEINDETDGMMALADEYSAAFREYTDQDRKLLDTRRAMRQHIAVLLPKVAELQEEAQAMAEAMNARTRTATMAVEGGAAAALFLMITLIVRSIVRPLSRLQDYARQVAGGDFNEISADGFSGELRSLHADITAMVAEIKARLGYAQAVLAAIPIPCLTTDAAGALAFANPQVVDYLGRDGAPEGFTGWPVARFAFDSDQECLTTRVLRENATIDEIVPHTNLRGEGKHMRVVGTPIHDMEGRVEGAITLFVDMTEQNAQQEFIRRKNETIARAADDANGISEQVSSALQELSAQVDQSSTGAEQQRVRTSEVATALEEMNATVLEVARNASSSAEMAQEARRKAEEGQGVVQGMVRTNEELSVMAGELSGEMAELGRQAEGIGAIMNVISDIADQTNLLALNAAIEAARAGDAGRGFAVVADEVRKLAEKTMQATNEVGGFIQSIQHSAEKNISATEKTTEAIERSTTMSTQAGRALEEIVRIVEKTSDQVRSIATAAEEQSAASEQISRSAEEINGTAMEIAQAMGESAQAVNGLAGLSEDLNRIIGSMQD